MSAVVRSLPNPNPATGVGLVPSTHGLPIVVLVVDDSEDRVLASVLASDETMAARDYDGTWSAQVNGERLTIRFHLTRRDGQWERNWTYADPGAGVLEAITAGSHRVSLVPATGDLSDFVREGLGGAIIVETQASGAIVAAHALHPQLEQSGS